ncbi:MAG TPA: peptidoglycan recognition family protein [Bryobacteraceae bacterium]|nr:peptidoglycan recognition family protein [Bryobacteraceae bacterium]
MAFSRRNQVVTRPALERQAQYIGDPIEKLHFLRREMERGAQDVYRPWWRRLLLGALVIFSLSAILPAPVVVSDVMRPGQDFEAFPGRVQRQAAGGLGKVWIVEESHEYEVYSNGLRVDNNYAIENQRRFYQVLNRVHSMQPAQEWRSQPVGIVFHTTESNLAPFEADQNGMLKRLGRSVLNNIREKRSYNFVIDRFGRVFRVVDEADMANHAGNSVWADNEYAYVNLNNSFLAVAFEAQTEPGDGGQSINTAQVHAGRVLTQMLRSKYGIAAENCVTHAQVSVNPFNMRIGYHTDWARNFPFSELGLSNNYELPLGSLSDFGFEYDDTFLKAIGPRVWKGLELGMRRLEHAAAASGRSVADHRSLIRERYRRLYSAYKQTGALEESSNVTN